MGRKTASGQRRNAVRSQPGMHAVSARLVGRGGHNAALGRVPVAADHHGPAAQLGMPEHLDGGDELVEVHVQDPVPHALSLAEPGQAGPAGSRSWPWARGICRGPTVTTWRR